MTQTIASKEDLQEMMAVWPDVVRDITDMTKDLNNPDITKWVEKVLQYNVPKGKKNRGLSLIYAYKLLVPNDKLTQDNLYLIRILAWCMELNITAWLMTDDIMDRSLFRRNQLCWYRCNDLGLMAITDCRLPYTIIFNIIQKYFKEKECYINLLELFYDIYFKTAIGQNIDMLSTNFGKKPNLDLLTIDRYNSLVIYKTAYLTYIFPINAAMHLAGIKDPEMFRQIKPILLKIGHLFQVQDDYLACFGNPEACGKDNTDIEEGKCTWLVVTALQRATPEQRKIIEECYGRSDPEKVRRVIQLFTDLGLPDAYSIYEKETYNLLIAKIQQIPYEALQNILQNSLQRTYKRIS
ncbi:farnesyl pyrophosphate synthase isoform X2 [Monomorium pharaonis]|uniref:farnesyl pyrophosphate synthase isoform X1 n=1 Tax=Monomorium pharaonis TaxID=307658 RepID=UPI0017468EC7|nr:farnesyl pyrophosphate synthase isoform X1 [Monomorium pharaonis]XP_036138827.1 farnesyl pyrophosphate synthase isoform X2 [Monomorium pharaonis]